MALAKSRAAEETKGILVGNRQPMRTKLRCETKQTVDLCHCATVGDEKSLAGIKTGLTVSYAKGEARQSARGIRWDRGLDLMRLWEKEKEYHVFESKVLMEMSRG